MNRLRPLAPLLVAMLASCQTSPSMDARTSPPAHPADPGIGQAMDPDTGQVYYVVCDPCLKPTPKTRALPAAAIQAPPVAAAPQAAVPVSPASPAPDAAPAATGAAAVAAVPVQISPPSASPAQVTLPSPPAAPAPVVHCVPFAFSRATFGPVATKTLTALVQEARGAESIHIRAYTSRSPGGRSSPDANEALAAARAAAIRQHLIQAGIAPSRISTSHCTDCFIESNDTVAGQRANRQAIVILRATHDTQPPAEIDRKRHSACRLGGPEACK